MKTRVYIADVSALADEQLFKKYYSQMIAERKDKIDKVRFDKDKRLSLGAGVLEMLARRGWQEDSEAQAAPEAQTAPETQAGVFTNLSHSGTFAMCAVSNHEIGCDIEQVRLNHADIAERFFAADEYELVKAQRDKAAQEDLFFRLWTLKESFMKATRLGFELPLGDFSILPEGGVGSHICIKQHVNESDYALYEYDLRDVAEAQSPRETADDADLEAGYKASVCIRDYAGEKPELIVIDLKEVDL